MSPLVKRLLSPAGFLLVLLLFLLPFVSISCEVMGTSVSADYSGLDVVTNGDPSAEIPPGLDRLSPAEQQSNVDEDAPPTNAQLWAILAAAIVAIGLLTALIAAVRARMTAAAVLAGLGIAALVVTQIVAQQNLTDQLWQQVKEMNEFEGLGFSFSQEAVADTVGWEIGFLLALLVLAAVLLGNVGGLTYGKWKRFVPRPAGPRASIPPFTETPQAEADVATPPMGTELPVERVAELPKDDRDQP